MAVCVSETSQVQNFLSWAICAPEVVRHMQAAIQYNRERGMLPRGWVMEVHGDTLIFRSGKRVYAHGGTVGIDPQLQITEGYDGSVRLCELTHAERIELAVFMLALWTAFLSANEAE